MASWPSLPDVRSYLRMQPDPKEDAIIDQARSAAVSYGVKRYGKVDDGTGAIPPVMVDRYPTDSTTVPEHARQACMIHAAWMYRRRDSSDGTIGFEVGAIRVGRIPADILDLYGADAPVVFG